MAEFLNNLDWSVVTDPLLSIIPALICIILHEISHGYVAYRLGDNTAKDMGRLTLNPIKHIDIFGLISMVVIHFGWAKPVPIDPRNFKNPKRGMALTALAGPASNLIIAIIALFIYGCFLPLASSIAGNVVMETLARIAIFSVWLGVFNMLPIPPMDGSKFFFAIASDKMYFKLMRYERYGMVIILFIALSGLMGLPFADRFYGALATAVNFVLSHLHFITEAGYGLVNSFM